jgi:predicted AlkP superfamily phosphohydrolase/phosphomutase
LALQTARAGVGETGLLAIISDTSAAPVERFVNVNNFLAEMGIIERDEQSGQIIWSDSLAYFAGHGQLWINLLGRDPQGAVHPQDEYEEVRASLVKALPQKLLDAGKQVIESVYRKEDLYTSEYLFCLPDLVVVFKPGYAPSSQSARLNFDATTFTAPTSDVAVDAGIHPSRAGGFVLASAPALARGVVLPEAAPLTSLVPTLLHALSVEYVDMEELAVSELFLPSYLEQHPIRSNTQNQDLSEEDEERIINHLRDLGYV